MNKISSSSLFFSKRIFPLVWFGFLAVFVGMTLVPAITRGPEAGDLAFLVVPTIMAVIGYVMMKNLVWDLVDEVWDHGDYLVIKNRGDEARIELADVMNVSVSTNMNPPRITLRLVRPTRFGTEISFSPVRPFTLNPFAKNEIAEDLIVRVDRARSKRAV
ncbi:MAG TPA: hypothetical protein VJ691_13825 [Vicinamibacterales bacterium]|nr:hypothetical protein [Vicinamibacterales bacterium]